MVHTQLSAILARQWSYFQLESSGFLCGFPVSCPPTPRRPVQEIEIEAMIVPPQGRDETDGIVYNNNGPVDMERDLASVPMVFGSRIGIGHDSRTFAVALLWIVA